MKRRSFGRYKKQDEIGDGAMGRVYRCIDPLMRRTVAVKTVKTEYLTRDEAGDYLRRFRREAQAAGGLAHPNIVSIFDVGEDYFVMEYLEGTTLQRLLAERKKLPLDEALALLAPLADALDHAHRAGIVHRDIKPANIMVLADGRPKLMDFGVAQIESSVATAAGQIFGSPSYMAPEQVAGQEVTFRADLFAFAVVAYEAITGQRPFQGDSITAVIYRVVNEEAPPPRLFDVDLPPSYDEIFRVALKKNPQERFPDAASLIGALQQKDFDAAMLVAFDEEGGFRPAPPASVTPLAVGGPAGSGEPSSVPATRPHEEETHALGTQPGKPRLFSPLGRRVVAGLALLATAVGALAVFQAWSPSPDPSAVGFVRPAVPFRVESDPSGAAVSVDGQPVGSTPLALPRIRTGRRSIRVVAEGYAPAELSLEIPPGPPPPPLRFVMEPVAARLSVESVPSEARVLIDGEPVGTTPLEPTALSAGRHEVSVELPGYKPYSETVESVIGQALAVTAHLTALPAPVRAARRTAAGAGASPPEPEPTRSPAWVARGDLVSLDSSVIPPRRIAGATAAYPDRARKLGMLGSVRVDMLIDENGDPQNLRVVESAGTVLDEAVLEAVRKWKFEPAEKSGVKVKVRWYARQTFAPS